MKEGLVLIFENLTFYILNFFSHGCFRLTTAVRNCRRSAPRDRGAVARAGAGTALPDPARSDWFGENRDDGERHRAARPSNARSIPQQDPGCAALRGAQVLFPPECG